MKALLLIIAGLMFATSTPEEEVNEPALHGLWVYNHYEKHDGKDVYVYVRAWVFHKSRSGLAFKPNAGLTMRLNANWSNTPPITYKNYSGTWYSKNDSIISLKYKYWGGEAERDVQIFSLNSDTLKLVYSPLKTH